MTTLRVVVADDEAPARQRLADLAAEDGALAVVASCPGGQAAIEAILRERPDLVFLDVAMPEVDGFDVIEAIGAEAMPPVVFVTAFAAHAVRAFEVHAVDYLLKPFDRERFTQTLTRVRERLGANAGDLARLLEARPADPAFAPPPLAHLLVRDGQKVHVVKARDVAWMEAQGNYVELHTRGGGSYLMRTTLAALAARLDPDGFVRVHRDTVVQVEHIRSLERWLGGQYRVVLDDGTTRPIGRVYHAALERRLGR